MAEEISLKQLIHLIAEERGLDLRAYKSSTLDRRIRRRMFQLNISSASEYLSRIREDQQEVAELLNTVLINVTEFFRDAPAWDFLGTQVLPRLLRSLRPGDAFRAWSAGCASGEEPYSLAILVAEILGPKLGDFDIKIYATDIDDDALSTARRGEYNGEKLRRMRPDWKEKYFQGTTAFRVTREIRRMTIFGRSNLISDAPISHCNLVLCRNVLIYFDSDAQKQIFKRLHYALEPNGILFLGKAESKLTESKYFRAIHPRWRIFQRITEARDVPITEPGVSEMVMPDESRTQHELRSLKLQHRHLLETVKSGVMILDLRDVIVSHNDAAVATFGLAGLRLAGKKLHNTEMVFRCPELPGRVEATRSAGNDVVSFQCRVKVDGDEKLVSIMLRPVMGESNEREGTIIYSEDITTQDRLQSTIEQLEATGEELQSANEELETTNEELQSTNEELETTNEELQSTNEELETTNEELQSLNEELENMNEELERRSRELNELTSRYAETLRLMPWPVLLVDREEKIQLWNSAAQKLFGVGATSVVGVNVDQLPMDSELRKSILRRCRFVAAKAKPAVLKNEKFKTASFEGSFDLHFTPLSRDTDHLDGVLIMFGPINGELNSRRSSTPTAPAKKPGKPSR
ncbi:MAG TPA: CheR family methyltransferase [Terriglobales bacterium]|nr:CheR family methyltransferase [Terriglobales bacterium]